MTNDLIVTSQHNTSVSNELDEWTGQEKRYLKHICEQSHLAFSRYFFKKRDGSKLIVSHHHEIMCDTFDDVFKGKIKRLVINLPPGYTKTEMAVIAFIARGLAINPRSKYIHASYSDNLALVNSIAVRDVITSEEFNTLWPMVLRSDSKSKKAWYNNHGGGLYAVATGGQVTGFRAGRNVDDEDDGAFPGAMVIDDPIKPDDAFSEVTRKTINERMMGTLKSRILNEDIPIIVIMQRVHESDFTDMLLSGGTAEVWHWLNIPAITDGRNPPIPAKYKDYAIPVEYDFSDGSNELPLWEWKHSLDALKKIQRANSFVFNSQYQQDPVSIKDGLFKDAKFSSFYDPPPLGLLSQCTIYVDTAMKEGLKNDWTVFLLAAKFINHRGEAKLYLLDMVRERMGIKKLFATAEAYWQKVKDIEQNGVKWNFCSGFSVESQAHGAALIEHLQDKGIPVTAEVYRQESKIVRGSRCIGRFSSGDIMLPAIYNEDEKVWIPQPNFITDAEWVPGYVEEIYKFNELMSHAFDDQCDVSFDAIHDFGYDSDFVL